MKKTKLNQPTKQVRRIVFEMTERNHEWFDEDWISTAALDVVEPKKEKPDNGS